MNYRSSAINIRNVFLISLKNCVCDFQMWCCFKAPAKRSQIWPSSNLSQTTPNMSQYDAAWWPNARNMLRPTMLRFVALTCCDRLAYGLFCRKERSHWQYQTLGGCIKKQTTSGIMRNILVFLKILHRQQVFLSGRIRFVYRFSLS